MLHDRAHKAKQVKCKHFWEFKNITFFLCNIAANRLYKSQSGNGCCVGAQDTRPQ
jgi:hypothetical protein